MKKKDNYTKALDILIELKNKYPTYSLGKHFATALADYGDVWGMSDKEMLFALEKYKAELEFITPEEDLEKIIEDGKNIDKMLNKDPYEETDEEDYYE